jgi:hypothetical protein
VGVVSPAVELGAAIQDLKDTIHNSVQAAIKAFEARTGATPCEVSITILEDTHLRSDFRHYCVGDIAVTLGKF